jgi:hypothetical protein
MPRNYDNWGFGNQITEWPAPLATELTDFSAGYVSIDAPEHTARGALVSMLDGEVSRGDRLVRAPGIVVLETLAHTPTKTLIHATLDATSELVMLAAPCCRSCADGRSGWVSRLGMRCVHLTSGLASRAPAVSAQGRHTRRSME